jgi:Ty3 transposon capsid-like protein/Zinc knuckle
MSSSSSRMIGRADKNAKTYTTAAQGAIKRQVGTKMAKQGEPKSLFKQGEPKAEATVDLNDGDDGGDEEDEKAPSAGAQQEEEREQEEEQSASEEDSDSDMRAVLTAMAKQMKMQQQQMKQQQQQMEQQQQHMEQQQLLIQRLMGGGGKGSGDGSITTPPKKPVQRALCPPTSAGGTGAGWAAEEESGAAAAKQWPNLEKLPKFKGDVDADVLDAWVRALMTHCNYYKAAGRLVTDDDRVTYAMAHLEGAAADWWYSTAKDSVTTLEGFLAALNGRFKSVTDADAAAEKLYQLKQVAGQSVAQYIGRVQQLLIRVPDMSMNDRIRLFARGLLPHLAQKVREVRPLTFEQACELAIRYEGSFGLPGASAASAGKKAAKGPVGGPGINAVQTVEDTAGSGLVERQLEAVLAAVQKLKLGRRGAGGPAALRGAAGGAGTGQTGTVYCYRCGGREHYAQDCQHPSNVCYKCKKEGHIKAKCPQLQESAGGAGKEGPGAGAEQEK